jgi:hypothetical protein
VADVSVLAVEPSSVAATAVGVVADAAFAVLREARLMPPATAPARRKPPSPSLRVGVMISAFWDVVRIRTGYR